ncbi:MAG: hypothetical protein ABIV48_07075 [Pyrinomonadaceae bacterium]
MKKVIVEEPVTVIRETGGDDTASSAIWAIAFIVIVGIIAGAVYYSGILHRGPAKQKVNVEVSAP